MKRQVWLGLSAAAWLGLATPTLAGETTERGKAMAEALCARCHSVTQTGNSPEPDAPPFRYFAQKWPLEFLEEALAEGIAVGHPKIEMPVFQFTPDEIDQLLTYMKSIQRVPED